VATGTKVTWTWIGSTAHSVTFDDGVTSATQTSGSFNRTFDTAGSYPYHCKVHGTAMSGTVVVK
jgi:plastocyanin